MYNLREALEKNKLLEIKVTLNEFNPVDIANLLEDLDHEQTMKAFRLLNKDLAVDVFSNLSSDKQKQLIESTSDEEISRIVSSMFLDDTVDLIEEMPAGIVSKILRNTSPDHRKLINQFLKYPEDSAGSVMTVEYVALRTDMTVREALAKIRKYGIRNESVNDCFAVDNERRLEGIVPINELIINEEDTKIADIMTDNIEKVEVDSDQEYVAHLFRKYDLSNMPVVDKEGRLVGIITIDDIVDVIDQENTEDMQKMAAMKPSDKEYLKESVFELAKHRILWLLILMISATATGGIIRRYETTLQSVVILAAFIPMLMDTGGNAGSQSSTLVIRGLALGEIKTSDVWKILWKEFRVSLIVGFVLAGLNFLRILCFDSVEIKIILVICSSLFFTVVIAKVVGGILPIIAKKLRFDPAIMASPLITTIVDACALMIYFTIATTLLNI
ncbi:Magnesium transporter MgtE [Fusobacterium sp. DD29]|uniref:magnesium transporter n=1 Tax=unclassified Fusobacterium TaxID=2648384 RepID=UPI001B8AE38C|nr:MULTISPECIES: magnesium transporter [unclassified Fusobacterium]MBR8702104.1 Magnesium transporter MgtE [Fusobacterium sp. DD45]MBR8711912.1 Magnesium transporter MgtE [Fusobacterium sp. DD28]MBR8750280.1 Magnesium transporter MgtE [Fusobacterium sp. DD29]MBR8752485.1 Magnesium transporter MgtE [Fusobacterium sp. DD26]MBR8762522.1 Magnesium transporter MgtE [Fusobacterium sp. DD25]